MPEDDSRDALRRAHADIQLMKRIADDWNLLTEAGKDFMLSALSSGRSEEGGSHA